jgi:hypothetical protein
MYHAFSREVGFHDRRRLMDTFSHSFCLPTTAHSDRTAKVADRQRRDLYEGREEQHPRLPLLGRVSA